MSPKNQWLEYVSFPTEIFVPFWGISSLVFGGVGSRGMGRFLFFCGWLMVDLFLIGLGIEDFLLRMVVFFLKDKTKR